MTALNIQLRSSASNKLHPTEFKAPGSGGYLIGAGGHINAQDKGELLRSIAALAKAVESGQVMTGGEQAKMNKVEASAARRQILVEAFSDPAKNASLGSAIASELSETANRDGFMRRLFARAEVVQGTFPRIRVAYKTQYAVAASSPSMVHPIEIRDRYVLPPEFPISTQILISEIEIAQSTGDILEEKMLEGQEAIMVAEDKVWKRLTDQLIGTTDNSFTIVGGFTPQVLATMRSTLLGWNLPPDNLLFAADYWDDFLAGTAFHGVYDPVSQYEIIQTGYIGRLMGMNLISDAFRVPQLKVLNKGEIYLTARSEFAGGYTDRGPVKANEINYATNGKGQPARGWYLFELMSQVASNNRAVVRGVR